MNQQSPVLPSLETALLSPLFNFDPSLDAKFVQALQQVLNAPIGTVYYQFFNLLLATVQPLSAVPLTGAAKAGAITLNGAKGIITTEALVTAPGATYTLDLSNSQIEETALLMLTVSNGTNTAGTPTLQRFTVGDQSAVIKIQNAGATPFNGTLVIQFLVQ